MIEVCAIRKANIKHELYVKQWDFPAGETGVRFVDQIPDDTKRIEVNVEFEGNDDLFNLLQVVDIINNTHLPQLNSMHLYMPYFPYARQDKAQEGECVSVKVAARLINSMGFTTVNICDPHSYTTPILIDRVRVRDQIECIRPFMASKFVDLSRLVLVIPDAGATHKAMKIVDAYAIPSDRIIQYTKSRNQLTGKLSFNGADYSNKASGDFDALVVDDICDGGGTFLPIAADLRKHFVGNIMLHVTHGIFSKGRGVLSPEFDIVGCYNDMSSTSERRMRNDEMHKY